MATAESCAVMASCWTTATLGSAPLASVLPLAVMGRLPVVKRSLMCRPHARAAGEQHLGT